MNQLGRLFIANLKMLFREKQAWFWSIFFPVILLVIFLTIFGGANSEDQSDFKVNTILVEEEESDPVLKNIFHSIPVFEWEDETVSLDEAEQRVKERKVDAAIVLSPSSGEDPAKVRLVMNTEDKNSVTSQAIHSMLNNMIQEYHFILSEIPKSITLESEFVHAGEEDIEYTDFLLTGLIALSLAQAGLFGLVELVQMRKNGMLKRLRMTPMHMRTYGISNILVRFILSVIQISLLSSIGIIFYDAHFDVSFTAFILMFMVGTLTFASIGYFFAAISKTMESYMGIANLVSFIMMFLSGIFFEHELLPNFVKPLSDVMPLTYFANGIRDTMLLGSGFATSEFWVNIGVMLAWGLVPFLLAAKLFQWKEDQR